MNVHFDNSSCLFKNLKTIDIIKKKPLYRKYYKQIFQIWTDELDISDIIIDTIYIKFQKQSYGTAIPKIANGTMTFDIELADDIAPYVSSTQNDIDSFKAKSIFQHELFHCREIVNLYSKHVLPNPSPLDDNFRINTTYNFIYCEAVNTWSEFYACYYNYKINKWHEIPNLEDDMCQLNNWVVITNKQLDVSLAKNIYLSEEMLYTLRKFFNHVVSVIAVYLQNKEPILLKEFTDNYIKYPYLENYFNMICDKLSQLIDTYPDWLSEDEYILFGKSLLEILHFNNLTYSTDDLSDNFRFKRLE